RFSSCRGVAFEIKPQVDHFAVSAPHGSHSVNRKPWGPFGSISRHLQQSLSRSSSHFCDLEEDDDDNNEEGGDDVLYKIEEAREEDTQKEGSTVPAKSQSPEPLKPKPKHGGGGSRLSVILLDQGLFTVYKRLMALSIVVNVTILVLAATGVFPYARDNAVLFSIANLFVLCLCRSEAFFRVVYWIVVQLLGWPIVPVWIKLGITAFLQSVGGIHSGCGISSIAWLIYGLVLTLKHRGDTSDAIIGVASTILGLLVLCALAAFPLVRHLHHNVFERTHRFAGWASLGLVWIFVILRVSYDPLTKTYRAGIGSELVKNQEFWFLIGVTILIVLPWLSVRRVPVDISSASGHASIIKFPGGIRAGLLGRISPSPLSEWHAFGIISENKDDHIMLAGAVGDFTRSLVTDPPTHLWVRTVRFAGLPYLTHMYNRVLLVATGSGICPFLSFMLQPSRAEICMLWVTKNVEQNFGKQIKEWMSGHPEDKVIVHDSAVLGRANVSKLSIEAAKKFRAEVVIVTSNPEGSKTVVTACRAAGIPAFGPIWDS
ncbi:hypothetical protein M569_03492, partial [Genlisea aurea]